MARKRWRFEPEHLRSHHFLLPGEKPPACVLTHGCTYERAAGKDSFYAVDRTNGPRLLPEYVDGS